MKKGKMKTKSPRQKLINAIDDLLRKLLKIERGDKCEICGRPSKNLGLFHILRKGKYPRLRFHRYNLLLSCWFPCHHLWHHDKSEIEPKIKKLRGNGYELKLKIVEKLQPKLTMFQLNLYYEGFKQELSKIDGA